MKFRMGVLIALIVFAAGAGALAQEAHVNASGAGPTRAATTAPLGASSTPNTPAVDPIEANDGEYSHRFDQMYQTTWGEGAIPAKYKQLSGVSISVIERCEACMRFHMREAARLGASRQQEIEALRMGLLTGGSITVPTLRAGYDYLGQIQFQAAP